MNQFLRAYPGAITLPADGSVHVNCNKLNISAFWQQEPNWQTIKNVRIIFDSAFIDVTDSRFYGDKRFVAFLLSTFPLIEFVNCLFTEDIFILGAFDKEQFLRGDFDKN